MTDKEIKSAIWNFKTERRSKHERLQGNDQRHDLPRYEV